MRLPDGRLCPYYYVERGRWHEGKPQCRLVKGETARHWKAELCATCPVPDIRRANACPHMHLHLRLRRFFLRRPRLEVQATCDLGGSVADPYVGCGRCHGPLEFVVADAE